VLSVSHPDAAGNKYGFEGGRVVRLGDKYHLFTSEMVGDPVWVLMQLGYWESRDGRTWRRKATLRRSSGNFDGTDARASLWSPLPVFDPEEQLWNLFYVAYRSAPNTSEAFLSNQRGTIWRAVSQETGPEGIAGPYRDVGVILEPGAESDPWEGLQGTDSFFPYQVGDDWLALYGSARTEKLPIEYWKVGLCKAPSIGGPWQRLSESNPLLIEDVFIENPIVHLHASGVYVCVYDNREEDSIGYAYSPDGVHWSKGKSLIVQPESGRWAAEVRTPLGLVAEEDKNVYSLFYTGFVDEPDWESILAGDMQTACAIGRVTVRLVWETVSPYADDNPQE
jgi:hypothetical protein